VAPGVPALKRSLVEQILEGKFVDLGEFPPAKGFSKTPAALSSDMEGKIVLLQAADYVRSKRHIPDLATWVQCFAMYSAVRQGPVTAHVLSCNFPAEKEISMAVLDNL
jgi:hypothetical protein